MADSGGPVSAAAAEADPGPAGLGASAAPVADDPTRRAVDAVAAVESAGTLPPATEVSDGQQGPGFLLTSAGPPGAVVAGGVTLAMLVALRRRRRRRRVHGR